MKYIWILITLGVLSGCGGSESKTPAKANDEQIQDSLARLIDQTSLQIRENPSNDSLYLVRAELYKTRGEFQKAYEDAQRAVNIDSSKTRNLLRLGDFAFAAGNYFRSEEAWLRCIKVEKDPDCFTKLAEFYLYRKKTQEAITYSNEALKVNQSLYRPYYIKGMAHLLAGDTVKAVTSIVTATEVNPQFYEGFILLGSLYSDAGKDLALDYFNSALAIQPSSTEALYFKVMHYQNTGRFSEAYRELDNLLLADSNDPRGYYNKGFIQLTEINNNDSAIYYFTRAIQKENSYYEAYYNRGYANELKGNTAEALGDYKLALAINPQFELAKEGVSRLGGK